MSSISKASTDAAVDHERGAGGMKEEQLAVDGVAMDPRRAMCTRATLDVFVVVYLLFFIGVTTVLIRISENWWDQWPGILLVFTPISVWTLWEAAKWKAVTKPTLGSDCDHLNSKLLSQLLSE